MKKYYLLIFALTIYINTSAQRAVNVPCDASTFYALQGNEVHKMQMGAASVVDLGAVTVPAAGTLASLAFGNDITTGSPNRTFYTSTISGLSPCYIMRYTGTDWDTLTSDTLIYHQAGGYAQYIYFQHSAGTSPQNTDCIARLNPNGTLTKIFTDTALRFTVADLAIDTMGRIYCFRGPQIGNTTELLVLDHNGSIVNSYSTTLNNMSTLYGSMFYNDTLFLGWGTTNGQLFPVHFSGSTATLGTGRPVPVGSSYKDLANCHGPARVIPLDVTFQEQAPAFQAYPNPFCDFIILDRSVKEEFKASIYNYDGRLLFSEMINADQHQLDMRQFKNGIYFLMIETDKGIVASQHLIKE